MTESISCQFYVYDEKDLSRCMIVASMRGRKYHKIIIIDVLPGTYEYIAKSIKLPDGPRRRISREDAVAYSHHCLSLRIEREYEHYIRTDPRQQFLVRRDSEGKEILFRISPTDGNWRVDIAKETGFSLYNFDEEVEIPLESIIEDRKVRTKFIEITDHLHEKLDAYIDELEKKFGSELDDYFASTEYMPQKERPAVTYKQQIIEYLSANPGISDYQLYGTLVRDKGFAAGTVSSVVWKLLQDGVFRSERCDVVDYDGNTVRGYRYYPSESGEVA